MGCIVINRSGITWEWGYRIISAEGIQVFLHTILPFLARKHFPAYSCQPVVASELILFCSEGVRSSVMNRLRMFGRLEVDLSLVLFFRMYAFSVTELRDTFRSLGFSVLCPSMKALVIDIDCPR